MMVENPAGRGEELTLDVMVPDVRLMHMMRHLKAEDVTWCAKIQKTDLAQLVLVNA